MKAHNQPSTPPLRSKMLRTWQRIERGAHISAYVTQHTPHTGMSSTPIIVQAHMRPRSAAFHHLTA